MEGKPMYYDGSVPHITSTESEESSKMQSIEMTDEIRKNLAGNPYEVKEK